MGLAGAGGEIAAWLGREVVPAGCMHRAHLLWVLHHSAPLSSLQMASGAAAVRNILFIFN